MIEKPHHTPLLRGAVLALLVLLGGCTTLPEGDLRVESRALAPASIGVLSTVAAELAFDTRINGDSSFLILEDNREALEWRLALIDHAQSSIDLQYYIWDSDEAGAMLLDRVLRAANRGVRVRILVDDILLATSDKLVASYSAHPNLEIRIFNPGRVRESRLGSLGEFIINFRALNRRMHNKLCLVDNHFAIVGGRNLGNEYFGLGKDFNFSDLDVLVAGQVIPEIASAFDDYWNADLSFPGELMSRRGNLERARAQHALYTPYMRERAERLEGFPIYPRDWSERLHALPQRMDRGVAHFIQDQPVTPGHEEYRLSSVIGRLALPTHTEVIIVTPYLIPLPDTLRRIRRMTEQGVRVRILTGSMASNNHTVAHSHYKKYRRTLLEAGVELYEFRHDPSARMRLHSERPPIRSDFVSLHVKAIVSDREECFIGSVNIDPRALEINTENGLYIQSAELSTRLAEYFDEMMAPENAWRVELGPDGRLRWTSSQGTVFRQPARSAAQRVADFIYRLLPVESQL